jgi:hypothetical protein
MAAASSRLIRLLAVGGRSARALHSTAAARRGEEFVALMGSGVSTEDAKEYAAHIAESARHSRSHAAELKADGVAPEASWADARAAALGVVRSGPDVSHLAVYNLDDVRTYDYLAPDRPLNAFPASELYQGVMTIAESDDKVDDLLSALADAATERVNEFPAHALADMAEVFVHHKTGHKTFVQAACQGVGLRAHRVPVRELVRLLGSAAQSGAKVSDFAATVGRSLAAVAESARVHTDLPEKDAVARAMALVLSTANKEFSATLFGPWAAKHLCEHADSFSEGAIKAVVAGLHTWGLGADVATERALAADRARRKADKEAAALNGNVPEDYGVSRVVV